MRRATPPALLVPSWISLNDAPAPPWCQACGFESARVHSFVWRSRTLREPLCDWCHRLLVEALQRKTPRVYPVQTLEHSDGFCYHGMPGEGWGTKPVRIDSASRRGRALKAFRQVVRAIKLRLSVLEERGEVVPRESIGLYATLSTVRAKLEFARTRPFTAWRTREGIALLEDAERLRLTEP